MKPSSSYNQEKQLNDSWNNSYQKMTDMIPDVFKNGKTSVLKQLLEEEKKS